MAKKSFLDSIQSPAPCSKEWNEMIGNERVRFCGVCAKNVYNLSAMPRKEARKFVARNAEKVCIRYVRLPNGKVLTADTKLYKITRRTPLLAAGVFGATLTLSAFSDAQTPTPPKIETTKTVQLQNKKNSQTSLTSFTFVFENNCPAANFGVKLIDFKTKKEFSTISNNEGIAQFSLIPYGRYTLKILGSYFRINEFRVQISQPIEPNVKIELEIPDGSIGLFVIDWNEVPLFQLIVQEENETVKFLINSGFSLNIKDFHGETALHVAVEHGNLEIVRFLIEKGANVNVRSKAKVTPILRLEDNFNDKETVEILRLLISKGAKVNVSNSDKETLLMMACFHNNFEAVKILLEAGANPNLKDEDGETALQKTDSDEIKQLLKQYGAKKRAKVSSFRFQVKDESNLERETWNLEL